MAVGMAATTNPKSNNDAIHELSLGVIGIGVVSVSNSFGNVGDGHPIAYAHATMDKVAVQI